MISWNFETGKGFCWSFVLILTFSFYEYFTDVLWAAFLKVLIKYIDYYYYIIIVVVVVIVHFFQGQHFPMSQVSPSK